MNRGRSADGGLLCSMLVLVWCRFFSGLEHNTTINICSLLKNTATKVTANVLSDEHNARLKVSTAANWGTSNSQHFMSACVHISHNNWLPVTQLLKLNCPWGCILTKCPFKYVGVGPWFGDCEGQATGRAWTGGAWGCWCTRWWRGSPPGDTPTSTPSTTWS